MFCALVRSQSSMYDNYPSTLFRFEPRLEFRFPPGFIFAVFTGALLLKYVLKRAFFCQDTERLEPLGTVARA